VDYFLCNLQDMDKNRNLNFEFKLGFDRGGFYWSTWQPLIGLYQFGLGIEQGPLDLHKTNGPDRPWICGSPGLGFAHRRRGAAWDANDGEAPVVHDI
jgi:hypothetical protein